MKVCITGITGQTGSYLAEQILEEGHEVYGLVRRSSTFNTGRINHIFDNPKLKLVYGDLADYSSILSFVGDVKPDQFFNMGAQSHVRVSFDIPEYTFDVVGTGTLRCLEAIRKASPKTRYLQASSSEMFGSQSPPQSEETPFHPRSPYGVAKVAGYWATVNYREAYDLFACNSISYNHECLGFNTPIIIRRNGFVSIARAVDIISLRRKGPNIQTFDIVNKNIEIWDGKDWTELKTITATKYKGEKGKQLLTISARAGVVNATAHHNMLDSNFNKIKAGDIVLGGKVALAESLPSCVNWTGQSEEMYELLGLLAADGFVSKDGGNIRFTNNDIELSDRVVFLWSVLFLGDSIERYGISGFNSNNKVRVVSLTGNSSIGKWLRKELYTKDGFKKVPDLVLNSNINKQKYFIMGYYAGDGLKKGKGDSFTTNSSVLAQGLIWMYYLRGRKCSVYAELKNSTMYYHVNIRKSNTNIGRHLVKDPSEVRKVEEANVYDDWVFDFETGSGVLCAGVGLVVVHNSERRGETFVTRKITRAATRIRLGLQNKLVLGNLDAKRDWTHAADVARAMRMIINLNWADDFVIGTGEMHSVQEFLELVFSKLGLNYKEFVEFDSRYLRPSEVEALCSDPSKLKRITNWEPEISFEKMVEGMIENDMKIAQEEKILKENKDG